MHLLYRFLKVALFPILRVYFRRMYFSNRKNIPTGKPILLACNHPNSFLDGVAVSYLMFRRTYVLVRGDVFKKKWTNAVLRSMCLLPIFRERDGADRRENMRNNDLTFEECYRLFKKNHIVLIFSEAVAKVEKRLRPIKKGTARMAFDAAVKSGWKLDLHVVPTSLNYTHFRGFRKELMIDFCPAIRVADFREMYEQNANQAILSLTARIESELKNNVIICEDPEYDELFELHNKMVRNSIRKPFIGFLFFNNRPLKSEIQSAQAFNKIVRDDERGAQFTNSLQEYQNRLSKLELTDKSVLGFRGLWWKALIILVFTLPSVAGMILVWLPYWLASGYTPKLVKRKEFFDSVLLGLSLVFDLIYSALLALALYFWFGKDFWWIFAAIKVLGIFSLLVWELWGEFIQYFRSSLFNRSNPSEFRELKKMRSELLSHS